MLGSYVESSRNFSTPTTWPLRGFFRFRNRSNLLSLTSLQGSSITNWSLSSCWTKIQKGMIWMSKWGVRFSFPPQAQKICQHLPSQGTKTPFGSGVFVPIPGHTTQRRHSSGGFLKPWEPLLRWVIPLSAVYCSLHHHKTTWPLSYSHIAPLENRLRLRFFPWRPFRGVM